MVTKLFFSCTDTIFHPLNGQDVSACRAVVCPVVVHSIVNTTGQTPAARPAPYLLPDGARAVLSSRHLLV